MIMTRKGLCAFLRHDGFCLVRRELCKFEHEYAPCPDAVKRSIHRVLAPQTKMVDYHLETAKGRFKHHTRNARSGVVYWECGRKSRFRTECEAAQYAKKFQVRYGVRMYYYPCRFCEGFHLTKKERKEFAI